MNLFVSSILVQHCIIMQKKVHIIQFEDFRNISKKNLITMKKALSKLFELRQALDASEKDVGLDHLSEVERAVFSFITSNENVTITSISIPFQRSKEQFFTYKIMG